MASQGGVDGDETLSLEGAETLPPDDDAVVVSSTAGPPLATWDRYELFELLGRGGMGSVYKARDRRLDRILAIKFLRGADPNLTLRFLREARAQAQIDHPNICRVYEVGEVSGHAYIALQFVDGESLHQAAKRMPLDEKIAVMRDVAVAIHEAHRLGIVHRDLKPANVMIDRNEDGRSVPVVMDFGLAREATVDVGLTTSGAVLGTPAYMSPEQARGDGHAVDRRSDVYSLGATLYQLLTGHVPFPSTSLAEVLMQVIHDDPPAPRSLVPSLPPDLETVALKCLAKDPAARYPSARALADDLGRYLDGEPIRGRRLSLWQRARLRARRHRALVVLGAWSLAIILAVGAFGVRTWIRSSQERERTAASARLAERLGSDAKDIEMSLQQAYEWPLHDTRDDRVRVRAQMLLIAVTPHGLGGLGDAVVHEALGRGYLALHEWGEAEAQLARAAAAGWPGLHAARGRALGELYHRAFEEARLSGDKAWLARRQPELAQQYLMPALGELAASRSSGEDSGMLEALIAFYGGDFPGAERLALAAAEREPMRVEAHKLAADAAYSAARKAFDQGEYEAARPGLERATARYAAASDIARSDASVYEAAALAWRLRAEIDFSQGRDPRESLESARDTIDRALRADPEDALAYTIQSQVLLRWYLTPGLVHEADKPSWLDRIAQAATRSIEIENGPGSAHAWTTLGTAHLYRGMYEFDRGNQGVPWWNRAVDEYRKVLAIHPNNPQANNGLGTAHRLLGSSLEQAGRDPMPEYQEALRSYERAIESDPQYFSACNNQAELDVSIAEYDDASGIDPGSAVDLARHAAERCLKLNAGFYQLLNTLVRGQLALAHHLVETGGDPTEPLASAHNILDRDEAAQPSHGEVWYQRLVAAGLEATFQLHQKLDPTSALATGQQAAKKALNLMPSSADVYIEMARLDLVQAAWAERTGNGASLLRARARDEAKQAIALDKQLPGAWLMVAEACLQIATAQHSGAVVDEGIAHVEQALKINPRLPRAKSVRTDLLRLRTP